MKPRTIAGLAVMVALVGTWTASAPGQGVAPATRRVAPDALVAFEITLSVLPTPEGASLRCEERGWRVFDCPEGQPCTWKINEYGLLGDDSGGRPPSRVRLAVEARKGRVDLKCERGCMWTRRSIPCSGDGSCTFSVNEFGIQATRSAAARSALIAERSKVFARRLAAEKKPDFSGRWVVEAQSDPTARVARELVVRQWLQNPRGTEPGVSITRVLSVQRHVGDQVLSERYEMDGPESGVVGGGTVAEGPAYKTQSSRHWDSDTFVIEDFNASRASGAWSETEHRETWALDPHARLVITTSDRVSGSEPKTLCVTYRRR